MLDMLNCAEQYKYLNTHSMLKNLKQSIHIKTPKQNTYKSTLQQSQETTHKFTLEICIHITAKITT